MCEIDVLLLERDIDISTYMYMYIGLRMEDLYVEEDPVVAEALRRLPQEEQDLRLWRLKRALDLSLKKMILPRDQWTTEEEVQDIIS